MSRMVEVTVPETEEEGTESTLGKWFKQIGDSVAEHEPLLEINTDKVVVEIASPASGKLREIRKKVGESLKPGEVLGVIARGDGAAASTEPAPEPRAQASRPAAEGLRLSPAVRRLIETEGLDPSGIQGSGRGGRITFDDVKAHLERLASATAPKAAEAATLIPHTPRRLSIARHMVESALRTAPHVTSVFEADFSFILRDRAARKNDFEKRGVRLTLTAYLIRAAVKALQKVPEVNSSWTDEGLQLHARCNIGIATSLEKKGLIVPVLERAETLDLFETAKRLQALLEEARSAKIDLKQLRGGTFTITNHGMTGSLLATPIINQPQSAILGVGKVEKRLRVEEGEGGPAIEIRPMAFVTLTVDHRALDGFTANLWLSEFVRALETEA